MTVILGINAYHGDVSAALLKDGELLSAVEEERFNRIKHSTGFPTRAIQSCLDAAGIGVEEIDHVAVSRNPRANLLKKAAFAVRKRPDLGMVRDRVKNLVRVQDLATTISQQLGMDPEKARNRLHWIEH